MRSGHEPRESALSPSTPIRNPDAVLRYVASASPIFTPGMTVIILLDRGHRPLGCCAQTRDCFSPEGPDPKTIFSEAITYHAALVILVQHHALQDSGAFDLAEEQLQHASKCALAGQLLDIPVLDYLIMNQTHNKSLLIDYRGEINRAAREYAQRSATPLTSQLCLN